MRLQGNPLGALPLGETMPTAGYTKLQAVNVILSLLGEDDVTVVADDGTDPQDVKNALRCLDEASREVQEDGWNFNTLRGVTITANGSGEFVQGTAFGVDVIQIDTSGDSAGTEVTLVGGKLYDQENNTTVFAAGSTLDVDEIVLKDFTDLPQAARRYITIKAARKFQARFLGDQAIQAYTQEDEYRARALMIRADGTQADKSLLHRPNILPFLSRSPLGSRRWR